MTFIESIASVFKRKKPPMHELKWKLPEERLTIAVDDANKHIAFLRRKARFVSGGEFIDTILAKTYGENTYAYYIIRTEKKTEKEFLLFDGYMIQEDDHIDTEIQSSYSMQKYLGQMGYEAKFQREVTEWRFSAGIIGIKALSITDFGDFIEISLPGTKFEKARELAETYAFGMFNKMGFTKEEVIPTDIITLQIAQMQEAAAQQPQEQPPEGTTETGANAPTNKLGGKGLF